METPRLSDSERFTAEEAGEILKRAAALRRDEYTIEDLKSIASEAGIEPEAVHEAVTQYLAEQRQREEQQRRLQEEESRRLAEQREYERQLRLQQLRDEPYRRRAQYQFATFAIIVIIFLIMFWLMMAMFDSTTERVHRRMFPELESPQPIPHNDPLLRELLNRARTQQ
ncbi:MAG: hypothetical protein N2651_06330 [Fimbriimonadales bacterium]|nr:hypothetical protein [Fimbriimonadales bacterium]